MRYGRRVAFIIPCFNEMRTVGSVVEIARSYSPDAEVIVVNDGSTDGTANVLASFKNRITQIASKKNLGKGFALALGIEKAKHEVVVLLDADTCGLTLHALDELVSPVFTGKADMTLGIVRFYRFPQSKVYSGITGFRAIRKQLLDTHISEIKKVGYGVEFLFNEICKNQSVKKIDLPYVYVLDKFLKLPQPKATILMFKQWQDLVTQTIRSITKKVFK